MFSSPSVIWGTSHTPVADPIYQGSMLLYSNVEEDIHPRIPAGGLHPQQGPDNCHYSKEAHLTIWEKVDILALMDVPP